MSNLHLFLLMMCGGAVLALQPSINARLAQKVGILESSFISFAVGTLVLALAISFWGRGSLRAISGAAWWELTGGFLGAYFVTMTIVAVPRLGTAAVIAPVGTLGTEDEKVTVNNNEPGPVARHLYQALTDIQYGRAPDPYGWTCTVATPA